MGGGWNESRGLEKSHKLTMGDDYSVLESNREVTNLQSIGGPSVFARYLVNALWYLKNTF